MAHIIEIQDYRLYDDLPSPSESDAQIDVALEAASNYISNETGGRTFLNGHGPEETTDILNGKGTSRLFTKNAPIQSITILEYWDGTQWVEYDLVTYPYSFKADTNTIYFTQGHKFYGGFQNIRVTYTHDFDTFPEELKYACYVVAKQFILEADRQGISTQSDGEQNFGYIHTIPKTVIDIIHRYKTGI